ncbi:hypothetical protein DFH28DRAFT_933724 [Melampsora americana]|nr:hypothetical protein DFH28DRAFT_933724 [Melampsora americana]
MPPNHHDGPVSAQGAQSVTYGPLSLLPCIWSVVVAFTLDTRLPYNTRSLTRQIHQNFKHAKLVVEHPMGPPKYYCAVGRQMGPDVPGMTSDNVPGLTVDNAKDS